MIEVRASGANKGKYARRVLKPSSEPSFVLCIGDDRTDIDMYRALPRHATRVHVGSATDDAEFTIESPERVRKLLQALANVGIESQTVLV